MLARPPEDCLWLGRVAESERRSAADGCHTHAHCAHCAHCAPIALARPRSPTFNLVSVSLAAPRKLASRAQSAALHRERERKRERDRKTEQKTIKAPLSAPELWYSAHQPLGLLVLCIHCVLLEEVLCLLFLRTQSQLGLMNVGLARSPQTSARFPLRAHCAAALARSSEH